MDFLAAVEAIGFDFALIGTLATFVISVCGYLLFRPQRPVGQAAAASLAFLRRQVQDAKAPELVLLSVLIAVIGMGFNVFSDQVFDHGELPFFRSREARPWDTPEQVREKRTLYDGAMCLRPPDITWPVWEILKEEDAVKQDAARDVCKRAGENSPARAYMTIYTSADAAKVLAQEANASVLHAAGGPITSTLRLEFLAVKTARALTMCAGAVLFALLVRTLAAVLQLMAFVVLASVVGVSRLLWSPSAPLAQPEPSTPPVPLADLPPSLSAILARQIEFVQVRVEQRFERGHAVTRVMRRWVWPQLAKMLDVKHELRQLAVLCIAMLVAIGALVVGAWMWTEQGDTYYKKLFYAHLKAKGLDSRTVPIEPPSITALGLTGPALSTVAEFKNTDRATGASGMFEFSAVTSFHGRVIVADNETGALQTRGETKGNALFAIDLVPNGDHIQLNLRRPVEAEFPAIDSWDDIEGLANDGRYVYAIGSHSVSSQGLLRPFRQALLRITPDFTGRHAAKTESYTNLYEALFRLSTKLGLTEAAAAPMVGAPAVRVIKDLNIEGLEVVQHGGRTDLLLGLRAPLVRSVLTGGYEALVLRLHGVDGLFNRTGAAARITEEARLDLAGKGISAIEYDAISDGYLLASAPAADADSNDHSSLWLWKPTESPDSPTRLKELLRFPKHRLEGIGRVKHREKQALLLAFDEEQVELHDGKPVNSQFGRLVLLEHSAFK